MIHKKRQAVLQKAVCIIIFLSISILGYTQNISRQVIGTAGLNSSDEVVSLSWHLGEPVVETFANSDVTITQGFQQGAMIAENQQEDTAIASIRRKQNSKESLQIFPNPATATLIIQTDTIGLRYELRNMRGQVMKAGRLTRQRQAIDISFLAPGVYVVHTGNRGIRKIIKQ